MNQVINPDIRMEYIPEHKYIGSLKVFTVEMFANIVSKAIEPLNDRFDNLEGRFDKLEKKVDHLNLNRKLDQYIGHVLKVDDEFEQLNLRMIHQESELIKVKARLDDSTQTA